MRKVSASKSSAIIFSAINAISHGGEVFRSLSNFADFGDPLTGKYIGMFYAENS